MKNSPKKYFLLIVAVLFLLGGFVFAQTLPISTISEFKQYKSDGQTEMGEGTTTNEDVIVFKGKATSPSNNQVKLQVELKEKDQAFNEQDLIESGFVNSGSTASITRYGLIDAPYHWRARAVDNQGNMSNWQEFGIAENVDFEVLKATTIKVAVILAEPYDVPHVSTSITEQPCKLISQKTYANGHNKDYFNDLKDCVKDYYRENSYGKVSLNFAIYNNGEWYKITDPTKTEAYYANKKESVFVQDVISGIGQDVFNFFDIVLVVHSGESEQQTRDSSKLTTETWPPKYQPLGYPPFKIIVAEDDAVGGWSHEIGHVLGELIIPVPDNTMVPDLYKMGKGVEAWDIMDSGSWSGEGKNPPFMSSYIKEFLQWFKEDIHSKSDLGEHWINSLDSSNFGDSIFRYNLENSTSSLAQKYYILEARNRNLKTWDSSLPEEKALVLYYVDTKGFARYGYNESGEILNQKRVMEIPNIDGYTRTGAPTPFIGVLTLLNNKEYADHDSRIKFIIKSDELIDNNYRILADIQQINPADYPDKYKGFFIKNNLALARRIPFGGSLSTMPIRPIEFKIKGRVVDNFNNALTIKILDSTAPPYLIGKNVEVVFDYRYQPQEADLSASDSVEGIIRLTDSSSGPEYRVAYLNKIELSEEDLQKEPITRDALIRGIIKDITPDATVSNDQMDIDIVKIEITESSGTEEFIGKTLEIGFNAATITGYFKAGDKVKGLIKEIASYNSENPEGGRTLTYWGMPLEKDLGNVSANVLTPEQKQIIAIVLLFSALMVTVFLLKLSLKATENNKKIISVLIIFFVLLSILCLLIVLILYFNRIQTESSSGNKMIYRQSGFLSEPPLTQGAFPDLDLHLSCSDGRHVGMNYQTGEYENQIPDSIVSGDNQGSPEWILIPADITNCKHYISSYDNQQFLNENPDIASQITDTSDSYELYARYIDPQSGIFTSPIIASQQINPGQDIYYELEGTDSIKAYKTIDIDIKPGSYPNSINLKSKGLIPVAILTTSTFDVKDVNVNQISFARAEPIKSHIEDMDNDGDIDLILYFDAQSLNLNQQDTEASLTGDIIKGTDSVKIVPNKKTAFLNGILSSIYGFLFEE